MYDRGPDPAEDGRFTLLDPTNQALVRNCISASEARRIACQRGLDIRKAVEFWNKEKQKCST